MMMTINSLRKAIERHSFLDQLTGVYNRQWCEAQLRKEIGRLPYDKETMTVVVIDIDELTSINDLNGQSAGNMGLKHVANTLRFNVRGSDWIARWGSDEFLLVLYNMPGEDVVKVMERIRRTVKERPIPTLQGEALHLSISLSLCQYFVGDSFETISYKIEKALYKTKVYGKGQIIHDYISLAG